MGLGELGQASIVPTPEGGGSRVEPGSRNSESAPNISVVVVFHTRREYLGQALRSLQDQTLPSNRFEVIVVGPVDPHWFLVEPISVPWGFIAYAGESLAGKVAAGMRAARASIVTFLEDDDLYEPTRLEHVVRIFAGDEDLSYFQNGYSALSEKDRHGHFRTPHSRNLANWRRRGEILVPGRPSARDLARLRGIPAGFNISSIAVRTRAMQHLPELFDRLDLLVDKTLMYVALSESGRLRFDPVPLTRVRVHGKNVSNPQSPYGDRTSQLLRFLVRSSPDFAALHQFISGKGPGVVIRASEGQLAAAKLLLVVRGGTPARSDRARDLVQFCSRIDTFEVRDRWALAPLTCLSLLHHAAATRIYGLVTCSAGR